MTPPDKAIRAAVEAVLPSVRADLERLVRIPSVSADPDAHLASCASEVAAMFRAAGVSDARVVRADSGLPAVLGARPGPPDAPTVLLYAHHDVQPPGDPHAWTSDPFEPRERDGRLFGRGAADDKAGIAVHLAALRALGDVPPVGVVVLIEGEEEIGSPTMPALLDAYHSELRCDVVLLPDSTNWTVDVPALTTSLRGGANVVVEVRTLHHAVHSGVYGGAVPDALTALCRMLASLHDAAGDVAVDGLAHDAAAAPELSAQRFRDEAGVLDGVRLIGSGPLTDRLWTRPAISVIGIDAPSVRDGANALIPVARAKVSMRIAPNDDATTARQALAAHLQANAPWGAHVSVEAGGSVAPYRASADGPVFAAARAAFHRAWGTPPVDIGVGGSIGFVTALLARQPDAQVVITGVEDPDTRAHGTNESLHLGVFERACLSEALLLADLGRLGRLGIAGLAVTR
jgi:acetylornithine deacetylase/succinyl-diaminopimelate desuccinylase-like protein